MQAILWTSALLLAAAPGELTGRLTDADDRPISQARVDVWTARPLVGRSLTCPSCYADCAKAAVTDADGRFAVAGLDPTLAFRVLILSPGWVPVLTDHINPAEREVVVSLEPQTNETRPAHILRGRVVDEEAQPIVGAFVEPRGAKTRERRWWGRLPGVDKAALTGVAGRFSITSTDPKLGMDFKVQAPGYATLLTPLLDMGPGIGRHAIVLRKGTTVRGRMVIAGKPVVDRAIGIVQRSRSSRSFVGDLVTATDAGGNFAFHDLQTNSEYALYTFCSLVPTTILKARKLSTGSAGTTIDLGELELRDGLTLSTRIELPGGAKIPAGSSIRVGRDPAWDWGECEVDAAGTAAVHGLSAEVVKVTVSVPGFEIDTARLRYQMVRDSTFAIRLRESTEVVVPLEKRE